MSFASQVRAFAAQAARERQKLWPATVTPAGTTTALAVTKSPTKLSRVPGEQGAGYVQRAIATFLIPVTGSYAPEIGAELTIAAYETESEVGTVWRCFDLRRGDANTGTEHRLVCFRLDD